MNLGRTLAIIGICTLCTFFERALPFLFFGKRPVPPLVRYLGDKLPMAVIATLVIYCLRGMDLSSAASVLPQSLGVAFTALLHLWKGNSLLSIAGGTALYMLLVQAVF